MESLTGIIKQNGEEIKERKTSPLEEEVSSQTACESCQDSGFTPVQVGSVKYCACRMEKQMKSKLAKIPKRFLENKLPKDGIDISIYEDGGYFDKSRGLSFDVKFRVDDSHFLFGRLGAYKTTAMWRKYQQLTESGIFTTYADTAIEMVKKYQDQCYKEVVHYDFEQEGLHVFMDDLDKVSMTEDRSMQLYDIFDQIYKSNNKLTITSNLSLAEMDIAETLGCRTSAITRRIMDICVVVRFN